MQNNIYLNNFYMFNKVLKQFEIIEGVKVLLAHNFITFSIHKSKVT